MKRRSFVKNMGLASVAMPFAFKNIKYQAVNKKLFNYAKSAEDRVLVIIRLNGGNDGLNTVIPIDQYDNLVTQRSNVLVPEASILPITTEVGLHPVMTGMQNMFNDGKLSIIQNVGYPEQNRSHFRSMDIWSTGSLDPTQSRGWLGRHFDEVYPNYPNDYPNATYPDPFAISMGYEVSSTCQGLMANFSHAVADPFDSWNLAENAGEVDGTYFGSHMEYLNNLIIQTNAYGSQINDAANAGGSNAGLYDLTNPVAAHLNHVANMISGGLKTKVYILNINGFDTHDGQVLSTDTTQGLHADLLKMLSDGIASFQADLAGLGLEQRVAGMTFSEFGRQIASNFSYGTDHGDAAPLFLFGACIDASIIGPNPVIGSSVVNQAGVPMQIDFRDVYASILKDWFEVPGTDIEPLFDHTITWLNVLGACNVGVEDIEQDKFGLSVFPNPARNSSTLRLTADGSYVKVELFNLAGQSVAQPFGGNLSAGDHIIPMDISGLDQGIYIVQVTMESGSASKKLTVVD